MIVSDLGFFLGGLVVGALLAAGAGLWALQRWLEGPPAEVLAKRRERAK